MIIAWLWRPTETSYMLAVSQQLSTGGDEDDPNFDPENPNYQGPGGTEFELDDLSLMSHDDDEEDDNDGDLNTGRNARRNVDRDSFEIDDGHQLLPKASFGKNQLINRLRRRHLHPATKKLIIEAVMMMEQHYLIWAKMMMMMMKMQDKMIG